MGILTIYYVVSGSKGVSQVCNLVDSHFSANKTKWLISITEFENNQSLADTFQLDRFASRFIFDSGGYSIATGARKILDLPSKTILNRYLTWRPEKAIGPDVPLYREYERSDLTTKSFKTSLQISKYRSDKVHFGMVDQIETKLYHVVQGPLIHEKMYSIYYRDMWLNQILEALPAHSCGLALAGLMGEKNLKVISFFALHAWSKGFGHCHLLGKGTISQLPVLVALGKLAYNDLSVDCTTYTIQVIEHPSLVVRISQHKIKLVQVHRSAKLPQYFYCDCSLCCKMQSELGNTLYELIIQNYNGLSVMEYLGPWLAAHNIIEVEKYVYFLNELANDMDKFISTLLEWKMYKTITAIKFIRIVLQAGRENYKNHLNYLNQLR